MAISSSKVRTPSCSNTKTAPTPNCGRTKAAASSMSNESENTVGLKRQLALCWRMLGLGWQVRKQAMVGYFCGALVEIASMLTSIYATAKLASLLAEFVAHGHAAHIWFWLWADIASVAVTGLSFLLMSYSKRMIYFGFVRWDINAFLSAVCKFDLADFYDTDIRNQLNKVGGSYIWQLPNLSDACLDLVYGIARFIA